MADDYADDDIAAPRRRAFLKLTGAAVAGISAAATIVPAAKAEDYAPTTLSEGEMEALLALLARMLPADARDGGAVEAGAHIYIDRALGGAYANHLAAYRTGLAAVSAFARQEKVGSARTVPPARMDSFIALLEKGKAPGLTDGGAGFFQILRQHMIEGTFGDPAYGGNKDYAGWRLIGFPGIQLNYTVAEQAVDGPSAARNRSMSDFGGEAVA